MKTMITKVRASKKKKSDTGTKKKKSKSSPAKIKEVAAGTKSSKVKNRIKK